MIDYDLIDNQWFTNLFEMREDWIPAYFKSIFMGGIMRVTSRSESENSFFDRFVMPHVTLVEFWMCYESAIEDQRHKQLKLNHENKHTLPPLKMMLPLEQHATETYTHTIFKNFQSELTAALYNCGMDDLRKNNDTEVYIITDTEREGKTWRVTYKASFEEATATCSCCLYQRMGLLCRHVLWVFNSKRINRIPENYIVHRSKDAMNKPVFDSDGNISGEGEIFNDKRISTTELWEEVYSCVSLVEENDDDVQQLIQKLNEFKLEILSSRGNNRTRQGNKRKEMEKYVGCSIPTEVPIQAPKKSQNKGSGKRIISQVINVLEKSEKKPRYCRNCGQKGHDSRNCKADGN